MTADSYTVYSLRKPTKCIKEAKLQIPALRKTTQETADTFAYSSSQFQPNQGTGELQELETNDCDDKLFTVTRAEVFEEIRFLNITVFTEAIKER